MKTLRENAKIVLQMNKRVYKLYSICNQEWRICNINDSIQGDFELINSKEYVKLFKHIKTISQKFKNLLGNYFVWELFSEFYVLLFKTNGNLVHFNHILFPFWKFPFAEATSVILGPAYTFPQFRNKGFYKKGLIFLVSVSFKKLKKEKVYIFVHVGNKPSLKAIEKVGFKFTGFLKKDYLGRYHFLKNEGNEI